MRNQKRIATRFLVTVMLTSFAMQSFAEYEVRLGVLRNDNIGRTDSQEMDETVASLGFLLDLEYESARITSRLVSDLEYWHYIDDTFDNEVIGSLVADATFEVAPGYFDWVAQDNFGDIQTDPFQAVTGANRETLNSFSTGPDFKLALGSAFQVNLAGRYSTRNYEITDSDSDVIGGRIAFVRAISANRSLSLNVSSDRIEFDNTSLNTDFDNRSAYLSFSSQISRGSITLTAGQSEIERAGVTTDGALWGLDFNRQLTARSTIDIGINQRFSDGATGFGQFQTIASVIGGPVSSNALSDPFENRNFYVAWTTKARVSQFRVSYLSNDEDYLTANIRDRDRQSVILSLDTTIASDWGLNLTATFERSEFDLANREDDDLSFRAAISRRISRALSVNVAVARNKRNSTVIGADYLENVVAVYLSYRR